MMASRKTIALFCAFAVISIFAFVLHVFGFQKSKQQKWTPFVENLVTKNHLKIVSAHENIIFGSVFVAANDSNCVMILKPARY